MIRQRADVLHEGTSIELALLHLAQLVFPLAGHFGRREHLNADFTDLLGEGKTLLRHMHVTLNPLNVAVHDEAFDDGRTRGGSAQTAFAHRLREFFVLHKFARAFHGGKQRRFRVAGRWLGLQFAHLDFERLGEVAIVGGHEQLCRVFAAFGGLFGGFFAVNTEPTGGFEHLAIALEGIAAHTGDAGGHFKLRRREKHGHEATRHHVEEFLLGFRQFLRRDEAGGDDGKVIAHLAVVEDALVRPHPLVAHHRGGMRAELMRQRILLAAVVAGKGLHRIDHRADVILRQVTGIRSRIGQHLELLIKSLSDLQRAAGGEAETVARLALEAREVIEQRRGLAGRFGLLLDFARFARATVSNGLRGLFIPQALLLLVLVVFVLLERFVDPAALVATAGHFKERDGLPVGARHKGGDLALAFREDGKRRRLHAAHRGEAEATVA